MTTDNVTPGNLVRFPNRAGIASLEQRVSEIYQAHMRAAFEECFAASADLGVSADIDLLDLFEMMNHAIEKCLPVCVS